MTDFQFRTRGQTDPKGKPRVYFTCHPEDFDRYFETMAKELLDRQNCAVFYVDMSAKPEDVDDYELRLGEMQLFVVPVTTKLLTSPNRAMDFDVPFAQSRNIPVLPLMQESGLENLFNKRFGDLQYLDKTNADPTVIPYDEKLTNYLNSVIVGDELAAQVRAAFDAYIFLSYRKKDRKYAQELMRLIHANPFCRDIAIWYDEFLTPGENFNDAIRAALEKSKLFALTVTPNLLEMPGGKPNFVMDKEYPAAKDAKKPILPVEMVQTGHFKLKMKYKGIPDLIPRNDRETLRARLTEQIQRLAIVSNNDDPQHNFFIGLAYLSGIDVEVDNEKALELITGSADRGFIPAIEKLVSMYNTGEGVKRDYHTAVEWQEKLVVLREKAYSEFPSKDTADDLLSALWDLGDAYYDLRLFDRAKDAYTKLLKYSIEFYDTYSDDFYLRRIAVSNNKLGRLEKDQGRLSEASKYFGEAMIIYKALAEKKKTAMSIRDLSISYNDLGRTAEASGDPEKAREYYEKALKIRESISEETDTVVSRRDLSISYNHLGDIAAAQGRLSEAKEYYKKSLEIKKAIVEETDTAKSKRDLSVSYSRLGTIAKAQGKLIEAKEYYEKALEIRKAIVEETGTIESKRDLFAACNNLGNNATLRGRLGEAKKYYEKAMEITKEIAEETDTVESRQDLSVSYNNLGDIAKDQGRLNEAKEYFEKALEIRKKIAEETDTVQSKRDLSVSYSKLGKIAQAQGRLNEAKEYYEKALEIRKKIAEETNTVQSKRDLSISYNYLGDIAWKQGRLSEAKEYYEKAMEISKEIAEETGTIESRLDLSDSYSNLGNIARKQGRSDEAKEYYEKALEIDKAIYEEIGTIESKRNLSDSYSNLGNIAKAQGRLSEAKEYYKKSLEIDKAIAEETGTIESKRNLSISYNLLGDIAKVQGGSDEAKEYYEKSLEIRKEIAEETNSVNSYDDLALSYCKLGLLLSDREYLQKALDIWEELSEQCPDVALYRKRAEFAEKELQKLSDE